MLRLQQCADSDFLANSSLRASTVNLSRRMNERRQRKSALCVSFRVPDQEASQVATAKSRSRSGSRCRSQPSRDRKADQVLSYGVIQTSSRLQLSGMSYFAHSPRTLPVKVQDQVLSLPSDDAMIHADQLSTLFGDLCNDEAWN